MDRQTPTLYSLDRLTTLTAAPSPLLDDTLLGRLPRARGEAKGSFLMAEASASFEWRALAAGLDVPRDDREDGAEVDRGISEREEDEAEGSAFVVRLDVSRLEPPTLSRRVDDSDSTFPPCQPTCSSSLRLFRPSSSFARSISPLALTHSLFSHSLSSLPLAGVLKSSVLILSPSANFPLVPSARDSLSSRTFFALRKEERRAVEAA